MVTRKTGNPKASSWFKMDTKTNAMGPVEKRRPEEATKRRYRELPLPRDDDE
jgi:hypothetical protein